MSKTRNACSRKIGLMRYALKILNEHGKNMSGWRVTLLEFELNASYTVRVCSVVVPY
jgi:hypothetical protein